MSNAASKPLHARLAHRKFLSGSILLGIGVFLIIAFSGAFELVLLVLGASLRSSPWAYQPTLPPATADGGIGSPPSASRSSVQPS